MKIPERVLCDFCKKENPEYRQLLLPVVTNCDWAEGHGVLSPYVQLEHYDICKNCLKKATNIVCGFQGANPTFAENKSV